MGHGSSEDMKRAFASILLILFSQPILAEAAPLVLEKNKYSYTFSVPTGWEFNFEQAHQIGARLVFFPEGGSFHTSKSIIYINEICKFNCTTSIEVAIQKIVTRAKNHSPDLKITDDTSLPLKAGGKAIIKVMTGSKDPRQAKEALAFIEQKDVFIMVVLTTKDIGNWDADYEKFIMVISGHKYFNCDTPDLAINCR